MKLQLGRPIWNERARARDLGYYTGYLELELATHN